MKGASIMTVLGRRSTVIAAIVFVGFAGLALWREPVAAAAGAEGHWYSVLPPLIAVTLALITKKIFVSLIAAVIAGGFLSTVPEAPASVSAWGTGAVAAPKLMWSAITDWFNLQVLLFVVLVLSMISVMIVAGGLLGVVNSMAKLANGRRSAQIATALMGLAVFIDDYANTLVVGSTMRPVTDRFRVSREKLAFLVDATSAPIAGVALISTWIGYEVGLFNETSRSLNLGVDGYAMFFDALGFRFYCILMLIFVFVNVLTGRDYGPMAKAERRAFEKGELSAPDSVPMTSSTFTREESDPAARVSARTAVVPIVVLLTILFAGLWIDGGGIQTLAENPAAFLNPYAWRDVISNSENNVTVLAISASVGLGVAAIGAVGFAKLAPLKALKAAALGVKTAALPTLILVLAWSLKAACDAVGTGPFLVAAVGDVLSPLWYPPLVFLLAGMTAFATGTSWGTMAILIPTAVPIAYQLDGSTYALATMITLAAILDGAIFGDHCSPISDTTVMSSISSSCDHIHHVQTQLPYALTVAALALGCGYIPAAAGVSAGWGILTAAGLILFLYLGVLRRGESLGSSGGTDNARALS